MQTTMQHGSTAYQYQQMDCPWSVNHTFRVCSEGEESMFIGQARLLDRNAFTSVSMAVEHLNFGTLSCPEGFCVVFSLSSRAYYLLFRPELRDFAYKKFKVPDEESHDAATYMQHKLDALKLDALMGIGHPSAGIAPSPGQPILWTLECIHSDG